MRIVVGEAAEAGGRRIDLFPLVAPRRGSHPHDGRHTPDASRHDAVSLSSPPTSTAALPCSRASRHSTPNHCRATTPTPPPAHVPRGRPDDPPLALTDRCSLPTNAAFTASPPPARPAHRPRTTVRSEPGGVASDWAHPRAHAPAPALRHGRGAPLPVVNEVFPAPWVPPTRLYHRRLPQIAWPRTPCHHLCHRAGCCGTPPSACDPRRRDCPGWQQRTGAPLADREAPRGGNNTVSRVTFPLNN